MSELDNGPERENISLSPDRNKARMSLQNQNVNDNNLHIMDVKNNNFIERMTAPSAQKAGLNNDDKVSHISFSVMS